MIDFNLISESMPALLHGAWQTLVITLIGSVIGFIIGTLFGLAQSSKNIALSSIATVYTTIMRGTPILIQIFFVIYVLPQVGITISPFWGAIWAIGLNSAAYVSNIIRSGIASVGKGQIEAARVLGLSRFQITRFIVLPQAIRIVLPALGNELITLVKESSLVSIVGVTELTREGRIIISRTYDAITMYTIIAIIYLCITSVLSLLVNALEKRMNRHAGN